MPCLAKNYKKGRAKSLLFALLGHFEKNQKKLKKSIDKSKLSCYNVQVVARTTVKWEHSSAGRASALQAEGHRFEPYCSHHFGPVVQVVRTPACHAGGRGFEPHPGRQNAFVAQSVEQGTENPCVGGSIPPEGTICGSGSVVERHLAKVNVASSNLVFRSKDKRRSASFIIWRHSQVVRHGPAKPLPPVQIWVAPPITCRSGGIGRRKGLKIPRSNIRAGSSPASGTKSV